MSVFDLDEFAQRHDPEVVKCVPEDDRAMFDCASYALRILDMPIRRPLWRVRSPEEGWSIPAVAKRFTPFVLWCASHAGVRVIQDRYAYLTVDQGLVKAGTSQRTPGCHVDGFQGVRVQPKVETDISYTVSDCLPTVFYRQTWDVANLDPAVDDYFKAFDQQAQFTAAWRPCPYEIVRSSAYTVHRADVAPIDMMRTFLRLTFSVREFDRLGNSINPQLGPLWPYVSRETPKTLRAPARPQCAEPRALAEALVAKWRRKYGVICAEQVTQDIEALASFLRRG